MIRAEIHRAWSDNPVRVVMAVLGTVAATVGAWEAVVFVVGLAPVVSR